MICQNCIHSEVCKHKSESVYACENYKEDVVRCKDCVVPHNKWTGCPKLNGLIPPPNFYCSYAEKKSEVTE